ncbi:MAG: hypothetical protein HQL54_04400 [Magnetococcales bacterium]|nr:hypothetical protein [Magnetococcales bacterium]
MMKRWFLLLACSVLFNSAYAEEWAFSGHVAATLRGFAEQPLHSEQNHLQSTFTVAPEWSRSGGDDLEWIATLKPRFDIDWYGNASRVRPDMRELLLILVGSDWELRMGINKVFWGVTESQHLVDIINQTDLAARPDGEEKLGQPMVNLSLVRDWGTLDLFLLPYFRERVFAQQRDRNRLALPIVDALTEYESNAEQWHQDLAIRWVHSFDTDMVGWDISASHFSGTDRDPVFHPTLHDGALVLAPYYHQIDQTSVTLQATWDAWLWKLETISRQGEPGGRYTAATFGFEYTVVGVLESDADLGVLTEYLFDDRGGSGSIPFANDVMMGARLAMNDVDSTELLAGIVVDLDTQSSSVLLETSRRFGDSLKVALEGRAQIGVESDEPLYAFRRDAYLELKLEKYF